MDSIFIKTILLIGSIFTVLTGAGYVKISTDSLTYDFKTDDHAPIYYFLNTENVGIKKVRFDVTSQSDWVSVYKEGDQAATKTSLELAQYTPLNFVLEIHPERLPDGVNTAKVLVEAVDLQDFSIIESKEINITVNKNLNLSPEIRLQASPAEIEVQKISPETNSLPKVTLTITPAASQTPSPLIKTSMPSPKIIPSPLESSSSQTGASPAFYPESKVPTSILEQLRSLIDSLKFFLKRLF